MQAPGATSETPDHQCIESIISLETSNHPYNDGKSQHAQSMWGDNLTLHISITFIEK